MIYNIQSIFLYIYIYTDNHRSLFTPQRLLLFRLLRRLRLPGLCDLFETQEMQCLAKVLCAGQFLTFFFSPKI